MNKPDDPLNGNIGGSNEINGIHLLPCLQNLQPSSPHLLFPEKITSESCDTAGERMILFKLSD